MTRHSIAFTALLVTSSAAAQEAPVLRLSLEEARARAVVASHRLAEARARSSGAEAAVAVRALADTPVLAASGGYTRTNHVTPFFVPGPGGLPRVIYPDVPNNYFTRLTLQWPIYSGGRSDALEQAARSEALASASDVAAAEADLRLEVARAFWAVVTARATVGVLDQALARTRAHVSVTQERLNQGLIPPNEVAAAEAQESRQRMLAIEAANQRAIAEAELGRLVGVEARGSIEPVAVLDATPSEDPSASDTVAAEALALRHERRALELRIESTDFQRRAALAASRPSVGITGGIDYARPNPRIFPRTDEWQESWEAGVAIGWSLWDGGRARAEAAQAAAASDAARQRLAEFDSIVTLEVRQRLLEISSGRAAVAAAEDAIRAATEARRVVDERYRAGVAIQIEVLDADVALLQAELDRTRTLAQLRFAEARLARAIGR
jgi:outer membrane protein TolC